MSVSGNPTIDLTRVAAACGAALFVFSCKPPTKPPPKDTGSENCPAGYIYIPEGPF